MAATIKIKNSSTAGAAPTSSDLVQGELAVNVTDKRLFTENASGTVVELGTNPSSITLPDGSASAPTLLHSGDTNTGLFFPAADTIALTTGGSERLRLDSSGNLGLGVTPGTWNSVLRALEIGGSTGSILNFKGSSSVSGAITFNARNDGSNWVYQNSTRAGKFDYNYDAGGAFTWQTAASGTAGNAITFTQAMTLDASGNLGVGTTSPVARVHARTGASSALSDSRYIVRAEGTSEAYLSAAGNDYVGVRFPNASSASQAYVDYYHGINSMLFGVNNAERARIDSSGNLLVGKTSTSQSAGGSVLYGGGTNGAYFTGVASQAVYVNRETSDGTVIDIRRSASTVGTISVTTSSTAYNTSSDYRLKHDISPMTGALAKVAALKPCKYKWNADGSDGEGFIAHELAEVVPHAVTGAKDAVDEDGNPVYQGIDTSFLVATLTAALQEQQAIIETLTNRITALEQA